MNPGSLQLRQYRIARRDGVPMAVAALLADILPTEAELIDADDARDPPPAEAYELPAQIGHNSGEPEMADNVAADQLRLFIERVERLEEEKRGIADDIKDVYAEAKANGYDTRTMREVVKLRRLEKSVRQEREALLDTYKAALGLDYSGTPLGRASISSALKKTVDAVNAGALGPGVSATYHPGSQQDEQALYESAVKLVAEHCKASTSWLQRQLRLGYNSAARLIERMEREGLVSAPNHVGARTVLAEAAKAAVHIELASAA